MIKDNIEQLQSLRQEIDSIDDDMHKLLVKRTELASEIAKAKTLNEDGSIKFVNGLAIRSSREASIHRRLYKNHNSDFPFASLARMWREMINAFTLLQADYDIYVYAPDGDMRCWEVARDQFGSVVRMKDFNSVEETVLSVEKSKTSIAVIPVSGLVNMEQTSVIFRLPFSGNLDTINGDYDVFALAHIKPEPSGGDDRTVAVGKTLPVGATQIHKNNDDIYYTVEGFKEELGSDRILGAFACGIGK